MIGRWAIASGALPFIVGALAAPFVDPGGREAILDGLLAYGAAVTAFLGGVRWGAELARAEPPRALRLAAGAAPSALAAAAILAIGPAPLLAMAALLAGGVAQLAYDMAAARAGDLPGWTAAPRAGVAAVSALCLALVAALTLA